jgi:tRNA-2-methylthio-N6-dimethylallyladenosine synthase
VQSGSDRILARMNRQYTARHYRETIDRLRQRCPDVAVTTDVIVGFPGETEADFEATLALMEAVGFDGVFSFRFSPRAGTRASAFEETVPEVEKRERLEVLQAMQRTIGLGRNRTLEGRVCEILVEGSSRDGTRWMGRTRTNKVVNFSCEEDRTGSRVRVQIDRAYPHSLRGTLYRPPA